MGRSSAGRLKVVRQSSAGRPPVVGGGQRFPPKPLIRHDSGTGIFLNGRHWSSLVVIGRHSPGPRPEEPAPAGVAKDGQRTIVARSSENRPKLVQNSSEYRHQLVLSSSETRHFRASIFV